MEPELINSTDIETKFNETYHRRDLFDSLLDENWASAVPLDSFHHSSPAAIESEHRHHGQGCKCTKIDCLKLYCECFARGRTCNENCICVCCSNKPENQEEIYQAKQIANYRNPGFFKDVPAFVPMRKCTCKKSQCKKKYCECFSAGLKCSEECECLGCENGKCHPNDDNMYHHMGIAVHA